MIKNIPALLGVLVAVASLSIADSAPDMKDMVQNNFVETAQNGVKLSLWESSFSFHFD
jgi:ABC-type enterochelin transport system permease subunit